MPPADLIRTRYIQPPTIIPGKGVEMVMGVVREMGFARMLQPLTSSQPIHFNIHENIAIFFYPSAFYFKNIQTMQNIG